MGIYKKLKIKMPIIYGRRFAHYIGEVIQIEEIWKPIKNYEGLYEVSNLGRIKGVTRYVKGKVGYRIQKEKIRKCEVSSNGYLHVLLCKTGNTQHTMFIDWWPKHSSLILIIYLKSIIKMRTKRIIVLII